MTDLPVSNSLIVSQSKSERWFDDVIATLRSHEMQLATDTADLKTKSFYKTLMEGNIMELYQSSRNSFNQIIISQILFEYTKLLKDINPLKLAFHYNDSEVLVWAEITDNDDIAEHSLIMAEAKINAKYHQYGFDIISTIVEESDCSNIPTHYSRLI